MSQPPFTPGKVQLLPAPILNHEADLDRLGDHQKSLLKLSEAQSLMASADFELVFSRRFSMAHRLITGCSQKCAIPHGHNEIVTVRLAPTSPSQLDQRTNMVEEFGAAKSTWHKWIDNHVDHAFQISDRDPIIHYFQEYEPDKLPRLLVTPGDPTTEMLCVVFMNKLNRFLAQQESQLRCIALEIEETPTNRVKFSGTPENHLPTGSAWFNRPDYSINDL